VVFMGFIATVAVRLVLAWRLAPREFRTIPLALLCGHIVMFGVSFGIEAFYQRHWWLVFAATGAVYALVTTPAAAPGPDEVGVGELASGSVSQRLREASAEHSENVR
jgi:putative inorganic carbon (hco3(-)) transporter